MSRAQRAIRAVIAAIEGDTLPEGIPTDALTISAMVAKSTRSVNYYISVECDDYAVTTPAARKLQAMIEDRHNDDRHARELKIQEAEAQLMFSRIPGYFPTPRGLAEMMVEIADLKPGMSVLEPSAGNGAICDAIVAAVPDADLDAFEINSQLAAILKLKGHNWAHPVPRLPRSNAVQPGNLDREYYDAVLMNPPFENQQDIDHIRHAYQFLKPDGILVAILGPSFEFRDNAKSAEGLEFGCRKWRHILQQQDDIPAGAFKESGTMVASRIMVIDKKGDR